MEKLELTQNDVLGRIVGHVSTLWLKGLDNALSENGYDLDHVRMIILVNISSHPGLCQSCFVDLAGRDKASLTRIIDDLEQSGLLKRYPDSEDRRRKLLRLTPRGSQIAAELMELGKDLEARAQEGIDSDELNECKDTLLKVHANLLAKETGHVECPETVRPEKAPAIRDEL